ncbi:MAG TPA: heme o synthase [Candidatus Nitrosopolaris sp.]|nr:heme o synthase [Candidatus Nitrosopolaris sp.]
MTSTAQAGSRPLAPAAGRVASVRQRLADYVELTKPRIVAMVLVATLVGYYLGCAGLPALVALLHTLVGTALAAAGTLTLNQAMEVERDRRMERTRRRPLPQGRIALTEALVFGVALLALGLAWLALGANLLSAILTATITVTYLFLYTPLKSVTSLCSIVGAVPGALPPVVGWAAARGTLGAGPWVLFAIMFLWQIPHSLAIGRMYRDDFARAGIRVLPVVDWNGTSTGLQVVSNCLALLPVGLLPTLMGLAGVTYFMVALGLGLAFLWSAIGLWRRESAADARRVLLASLVYLPVVLGVMALDKLP